MGKLEKVTAADVEAAEEALELGRERLEQLHDAFVDGRGEWQDYLDQKAVIEFAEAQVLRVAADKRKYDDQVRNAALAELRTEIDAYSLASGDEFTSLLADFEKAAIAFAAAFKSRNDKVSEWRAAAERLAVRTMKGRLVPSDDDSGIALVIDNDGSLQVGTRVLSLQYSGRILTSLLYSLATSSDLVSYFREKDHNSPINDLELVRSLVANLDHEAEAIPEDALFFRKHGGGLFMTGPENGFSAEIMKRDGLEQISREEALND